MEVADTHRVDLVDMAEHPEGLDLSKEQLVIVVCSTQVGQQNCFISA